MNYEKKYKEALDRARQFIEHPLQEDSANIVEYIFPELQEDNDERMKKAIMHILYENYTDAAVIEGVEIAEIVAWLEEQGKKKSADEVLKIRQELYQSGYNDGYKHGQEDAAISLEKESIEVDDGIRRAILEHIQLCTESIPDRDKFIAWLEKQKPNTRKREIDDAYLQGICDAKHEIEKQGESNPYSGVSFKYNGHIWGMCARDNGVDILLDKQLFKHLEKQGESPRTNIEKPFGANDSELQEESYDIPV